MVFYCFNEIPGKRQKPPLHSNGTRRHLVAGEGEKAPKIEFWRPQNAIWDPWVSWWENSSMDMWACIDRYWFRYFWVLSLLIEFSYYLFLVCASLWNLKKITNWAYVISFLKHDCSTPREWLQAVNVTMAYAWFVIQTKSRLS